MRTLAPCCRGATSVILPPETPFALRAVWPLRRQAESDARGPADWRPLGQATDRWLVAAGTPWSPAATEEPGLLPRAQSRPALRSSPCGDRPSHTGLLSDLSISGGIRGREQPPTGTTVFLLIHQASFFTRIIPASSLSLPPHTRYHES